MKIFISALLLLFCLSACKKQSAAITPDTAYQVTDLAYGPDALQKMDISLVANRSDTTAFVILIHGGAWMAGDKSDLVQTIASFTSQGINVANINYRLTSNSPSSVRSADLLNDVGSAVKKIHDQASAWHIRPSGYVSFGVSAGAHLSLLYGYSYDSAGLISAVIGLGSPTRFDDPAWGVDPYLSVARNALPALTGEQFNSSDSTNLVLRALSPYYSAHLKPTYLMHGEKDQTVPVSQSENMMTRLLESGTPALYVPLPNGGHTGEGASDADLEAAYLGAIEWVRKYSH